jgi:hypothetical protein
MKGRRLATQPSDADNQGGYHEAGRAAGDRERERIPNGQKLRGEGVESKAGTSVTEERPPSPPYGTFDESGGTRVEGNV